VVDINKADKEGETALHYAARFGREAVVSLLLSHRANALAVAKQGRAAEVPYLPTLLIFILPDSSHFSL
jgi:ankyrin repeat protein